MLKRWQEIIDNIELPKVNQKVLIWGAGNTSVLNHQGMLRENLYEELRVEAFIDTKPAGKELYGFPVLSPDILGEEKAEELFVLISTTNSRVYHEISDIVSGFGIGCCLLDAMILKLRRIKFIEASKILEFESQIIYDNVLAQRVELLFLEKTVCASDPYFGMPDFYRADSNDVIVDCGAYVGDSAERFIWRMELFRKYIAIEPDSGNYRAMLKRFQRLREEWNIPEEKLIALHAGVDEISSTKHIESRVSGLGSIAGDVSSGEEVKFWALDDLMTERYSFLKADIESYEYRMLRGARNSIKKYHPRMAICIYHNMVDMFSIPLLIHEMDSSYRLAIRHHSYGYEETVLYAF